MLASAFDRALAEFGGLASGDFAVAREEVDDEEVVHVQAGMGANQFKELPARVLAFDGNDNGLASRGVIGRLLAFTEEFSENAGDAEVRGVGEADAGERAEKGRVARGGRMVKDVRGGRGSV